LTNPSHVKFVMEIIGAGFTLNIEDVAIMERCVALYGQWLLSPPEHRPPGLNQEEQYFLQRMFYHMSFLFEPRLKEDPPNSPAAVNQVRFTASWSCTLYRRLLAG